MSSLACSFCRECRRPSLCSTSSDTWAWRASAWPDRRASACRGGPGCGSTAWRDRRHREQLRTSLAPGKRERALGPTQAGGASRAGKEPRAT